MDVVVVVPFPIDACILGFYAGRGSTMFLLLPSGDGDGIW